MGSALGSAWAAQGFSQTRCAPLFIDSLCLSPSCHAALWGARLHIPPILLPTPGMVLGASCPSWTSPGPASSLSRSKAPAPLLQWSPYTISQFAGSFLYWADRTRHRPVRRPWPCLCSILFLLYTLNKRYGMQVCFVVSFSMLSMCMC